jgi:prepilin-type N-terminal cleavage/methylation domain-containing protein
VKRQLQHTEGEDGFTLVELLVSMALVSLMSAYAFNLISRFRDVRRIEIMTLQMDILASARIHLHQAIGGTRSRFKRLDAVRGEMVFHGTKDSLTVSNTLDQRVVFGGLHDISYKLIDGSLTLDLGEQQTTAERNVLIKNVSALTFRYYGRLPTDSASKWHETWSAQTLPKLVRIEIKTDGESNVQWQPLDVALEVAAHTTSTN